MSIHITHNYRKAGVETTINMHDVSSVKTGEVTSSGWIQFSDRDGHSFTMFCDTKLAEMLEEAFAEYHDWLSSQEGPSFEDGMAAKYDAKAREDEARALK